MLLARTMFIACCTLALLAKRPPKWALRLIETSYIALAFCISARLFTVADKIPPLLKHLVFSPFEPLPLVLVSYLLLFFSTAQLFKKVAFDARAKRALLYGG